MSSGVKKGAKQTLLLFRNFQTTVASLWPESRGYISPGRSITSCVAAIRDSQSSKTIQIEENRVKIGSGKPFCCFVVSRKGQ